MSFNLLHRKSLTHESAQPMLARAWTHPASRTALNPRPFQVAFVHRASLARPNPMRRPENVGLKVTICSKVKFWSWHSEWESPTQMESPHVKQPNRNLRSPGAPRLHRFAPTHLPPHCSHSRRFCGSTASRFKLASDSSRVCANLRACLRTGTQQATWTRARSPAMSSGSLLLSRVELTELTGTKQPKRMCAWLARRGWVHEQPARRGDVPKVDRTYYMSRMRGEVMPGTSRSRKGLQLDFMLNPQP
jgi:hypothetical protein